MFGEYLVWLPEATVSIPAILTALFTGLTFWLALIRHRGGIIVEWKMESRLDSDDCELPLKCVVRNNTDGLIRIDVLRVTGPVLSVRNARKQVLPKAFPDRAHIGSDVEPGKTAIVFADIVIDLPTAMRQLSRPLKRLELSLARRRWSRTSVPQSVGVPFRTELIISESRSRRRPRKIITRQTISALNIENMAAKAAQKTPSN